MILFHVQLKCQLNYKLYFIHINEVLNNYGLCQTIKFIKFNTMQEIVLVQNSVPRITGILFFKHMK